MEQLAPNERMYIMNFIFRAFLTLIATSWMLIVYIIKEKITVDFLPYWLFHIVLIAIILLLSGISLLLSRFFGKEVLDSCESISLADNEFLPVYLGYFFISLSIGDIYTMVTLYILVCIFTFLSQNQYFNPVYLLLGYHYYHVVTQNGTRIFIISRGKVIRSKKEIEFENLRRINDTTYIEGR